MLEPQPILFGDQYVILVDYSFEATAANETPFLPFKFRVQPMVPLLVSVAEGIGKDLSNPSRPREFYLKLARPAPAAGLGLRV